MAHDSASVSLAQKIKTHKLRLFWFYDEDRLILCTNGMLKGTRQEQDQAIETARKWKAVYLAAKSRNLITVHFPL